MNSQDSNAPMQTPKTHQPPQNLAHNTTESQAGQSPDYKQLLAEIGTQFKKRRVDLLKRIGLLLAPVILGMGLSFFIGMGGKMANTLGSDAQNLSPALLWLSLAMFVLLLISPPWMIVVSHLFKIERTIWIDAYFDGITISSKQSWKLAKRLFWPAFRLDVAIFARYFLLPYSIAIGTLATYIYGAVTNRIEFSVLVLLLLIVLDIAFLWAYGFFMSLRLRYVRFLLIDLYFQADYSASKVLSENSKLRKTMGGKEYKTLAVSSLGLEAAGEAAYMVVGTMSAGLRMLGDGGKAVGLMVDIVGSEAVEIAKDFSKQTIYYTYYRIARTILYGKDSINTELYKSLEATKTHKNL